jgi:hypothetical protein
MFVGKVEEPVLEGATTRGFIRAGSGFHRKYWTWLEGLSMDICSSLLVLQLVTKKQVILKSCTRFKLSLFFDEFSLKFNVLFDDVETELLKKVRRDVDGKNGEGEDDDVADDGGV